MLLPISLCGVCSRVTSVCLRRTSFTLAALLVLDVRPVRGQAGNSVVLFAQAERLRSAHRSAEADRVLEPYVQGHPEDVRALGLLARIKVGEADVPAARALLTRALALSPNDPAANNVLGEILLSERHYPEAMDRFETVLATDLRDGEARAGELAAATQLALQARGAGNSEAALLCLVHARENLPDDPTLLLDLGILADQMRRYPGAEDALKAALALKPGDPAILYALARTQLDWQHFPEAEERFRAYLALKPADASAHFGYGRLLQRQQRIPEARAEFRRSIELEPNQSESYYEIGQMALDAREDADAKEMFEKTLLRAPRHGGALTGMGILAFRAGDFRTARRDLALAVEVAPEYQPAHFYYGLTLAKLGEKAASEEQLHLATELAKQVQAKRE